jgi:hypothetical protein
MTPPVGDERLVVGRVKELMVALPLTVVETTESEAVASDDVKVPDNRRFDTVAVLEPLRSIVPATEAEAIVNDPGPINTMEQDAATFRVCILCEWLLRET